MILFLVDMPKPTHGMSSINQQMWLRCQQQQVDARLINTVPSFAAALFHTRWWFVVKLFYSVAVFFRLLLCLVFRRPVLVYRSLNGGIGQVFDLCFLLLLRCSRAQVVLHHHSFSYLRQPSALFRLVLRLLKPDDRHLVLGASMASQLGKLYQVPSQSICTISNLSFFTDDNHPAETVQQCLHVSVTPLKIGHLANLSFEKGVREFVEVVIALHQSGVAVQAVMAGPYSSPDVADYVVTQTAKYPFIQSIGPVYGAEKQRFFADLDLFLFPSKYVNEAEPLVLFEAAQQGAFLAGTDRGCMAEQINLFEGFCFTEATSAIDIARQIADLKAAGLFDVERKIARQMSFSQVQAQSQLRLQQMIDYFKEGYVPESSAV
jgi:glycosyltransferase involved in cell wall biosynthesis